VRGRKKKEVELKLPVFPGIVILSNQYGVWYWEEEKTTITRYAVGDNVPAESGMIFASSNHLLGATAIACNREYARLNKVRKAQAAKPIEV
jgi:hypothetical protein